MWRYRTHHWNRHPHFYGRGHWGGNPFMWLIPLLLLVVFGGFIFKMLFWLAPFLLLAWGVSKIMGWKHHGHGHHGHEFHHYGHYGDFDDGEKLKNVELDEDKPKRQYIQTGDGQWVEII